MLPPKGAALKSNLSDELLLWANSPQDDKPELSQELKGLSRDVLEQILASVVVVAGGEYNNTQSGQPKTSGDPSLEVGGH